MKKRKICMMVLAIVLLGMVWFHPIFDLFDDDNHAYMNNTEINRGNFYFSEKSGFYDYEFDLYIIAPTKEIYYTLDGSEPSMKSEKYNQPIHISDASNNENVYCNIDEVSTGFRKDLIDEYCNSQSYPEYCIPDYNIDKCTVIRAVFYDENGDRSDEIVGNYFVGFEEKDFGEVNTICITTNPDNLFDYYNGIYTTGVLFDEYVEQEQIGPYWAFWNANYRQKGEEWEREAIIQIFDKKGEIQLTQKCGMRIQGGASRAQNPKSLNIYAREEYDGNNTFGYDFWGNGFYSDQFTLTSCGQDKNTKVRDRLMHEISAEEGLEFVTMDFEPYVLFLDGEYWGFYYITEKYDANYIASKYDVNEKNVVIVKNDEIEVGTEEDYQEYLEMLSFLSNADLSIPENWNNACEMIDMKSTIDYFACELYISRSDDWIRYSMSNAALWRTRTKGNGKYEDGKWRWMLFDQNSAGMSVDLVDYDTIQNTSDSNPLFNNLCTNEIFRQELAEKMIWLGENAFSPESINKKIDVYCSEIESPMDNHLKRFYGTDKETFYVGIDRIKKFFDGRFPEVIKMINNNFPDVILFEDRKD